MRCVEVRNIEREDSHGDVSRCRAEATELLYVGDVVAAAFRGGSAALTQVFELGEAFDEGKREKEEDAEAAEPGGSLNAGSCRAGKDANGVEAREDDDIDQNHPLEAERIG